MNLIGLFDIAILPFYLLIVYIVAIFIRNRQIKTDPAYRYFLLGLTMKIIGGIAICLIYVYYYKGGDTVNYYKGGVALLNLAHHNTGSFLDIMSGNLSGANYLAFTGDTGYPPTYMYKDSHTFAVIRFTIPIQWISMNSFLVTSVMLSVISYTGVWKLYQLFTREFPGIEKYLAWGILFVPSVFFWGSGILKDTYTFAAACWFTYAFHQAFLARKNYLVNGLILIFSIYLMIEIKPYIFIALLPGSLMWFLLHHAQNMKNVIARTFLLPILLVVLGGITYGTFSAFGDQFGKYSVDNLVDMALIVRDDLERGQYGDHKFQLTTSLDGSVSSMLNNAPIAITSALFRPFLWEAKKPIVMVSALENFIILLLVITTLLKVKMIHLIRILKNNPILVFSLLFALFFAFSVGLTTANYGAMVRYKIPLMPYFITTFVVLRNFPRIANAKSIRRKGVKALA